MKQLRYLEEKIKGKTNNLNKNIESTIINDLIKRKLLNNFDNIICKIRSLNGNKKFLAKVYVIILVNEINKIYNSVFGYDFIKTLITDLGIKEDFANKLLNKKEKLDSIIIITYIILKFY